MVDNQSIGKDVWFDNIHIEHYTSEVLEEDHYYPFGLTVQLDQNASVQTKQPYKLTTKELETAFGLNWYDFGARPFDMQRGQWVIPDPLANKMPTFSPYVYNFDNPVNFIDVDGREPIKSLVGTINEALGLFRDRNMTTVAQINDFYANPTDANGNRLADYTRYVYTEGNGWIDMRHYFKAADIGEPLMDAVEVSQCAAGMASCYSYEYLPSNAFGGDAKIKEIGKDGSLVNMSGEKLFKSVETQFDNAGATSPQDAPNYENLPARERPKVPEVKPAPPNSRSGINIPLNSDEKKALIKTGNYVPQNFSEKPYNLKDFPKPGPKYQTQ